MKYELQVDLNYMRLVEHWPQAPLVY